MLVVGIVPILAAVLGEGILGLGRQRRVRAVTDTLSRVAGGDLPARIHPIRDREDLDQLARRMDDTTAKLEILMHQAREFIHQYRHDLKTPLILLRLRLESVEAPGESDGDRSGEILAALAQTDKIIAVFDAFLRIARLESGTFQAGFEPFDLVALADDAAKIYAAVVEDGGRRLD